MVLNENAAHEASESHGGRPLDATRDDVLRASALELLADIGYDRITIDKIAAHAGAGKATIYRRWSGKAELIVDALMCQKGAIPVAPDTGSLRGDLSALIDQSDLEEDRLDSQVMIGLVSALPHDAELRDVFRSQLIEPHTAVLAIVFDRAVERGEIRPVDDMEMIVSILPALVFHRLLVSAAVPDRAFFESIVEGVLLPLLEVGSYERPNTKAPPIRKRSDDDNRRN
jgi:AcrR family transcriptional regulator